MIITRDMRMQEKNILKMEKQTKTYICMIDMIGDIYIYMIDDKQVDATYIYMWIK